jgi:hypothetical protein
MKKKMWVARKARHLESRFAQLPVQDTIPAATLEHECQWLA